MIQPILVDTLRSSAWPARRRAVGVLPPIDLRPPRSTPRFCPACRHDLTTVEGIGHHNTRAAWTGERTYRGTLAPAPMSKHWHQGEGKFA